MMHMSWTRSTVIVLLAALLALGLFFLSQTPVFLK